MEIHIEFLFTEFVFRSIHAKRSEQKFLAEKKKNWTCASCNWSLLLRWHVGKCHAHLTLTHWRTAATASKRFILILVFSFNMSGIEKCYENMSVLCLWVYTKHSTCTALQKLVLHAPHMSFTIANCSLVDPIICVVHKQCIYALHSQHDRIVQLLDCVLAETRCEYNSVKSSL